MTSGATRGPALGGTARCLCGVRPPPTSCIGAVGNDNGKPTYVTYTLEPHAGSTRLTFEHVGFTGIGGFILAKLMMGPGWKKMLGTRIPAVFADLDEEGKLRPGSSLNPKYDR